MIKCLIYTNTNIGFGLGNILRMQELYKYLTNNYSVFFKVDFYLENINFEKILSVPISYKLSSPYDVIIIDDPLINKEKICHLRKQTVKLIAYDCFMYDNHIDIIINLYNHYPERINNFKNKIFSGIEYAIIRDDIVCLDNSYEKSEEEKEEVNILVSIGGEDNRKLYKKFLEKLKNINALVYITKPGNNRDNLIFIGFTSKFPYYLNLCNLIICNGGTTLLEALYLNKLILAYPQNELEKIFINYISTKAKIFGYKDLSFLLTNIQNKEMIDSIKEQNKGLIDGKGKKRIAEIILNEFL